MPILSCHNAKLFARKICDSFNLPCKSLELTIIRYKEVTRLFADDHPLNTFRHSTYISQTGGGGGGSQSLIFLTDSVENRAQRKACSNLLRKLNVFKASDCVLSMHSSGKMYRYERAVDYS